MVSMTPAEAAYRAGCIVSEIDARFGLTPGAVNNACTLPNRLPAVLRHVWRRAAADPAVAALLDGFEPPDVPYPPAVQGAFWLGYYHQRAARDLPPDFPARLTSLREKAGLSVAQLAAAAGLSRQGVYNLEAGKHPPSWETVQKLADALGVTTDTFR